MLSRLLPSQTVASLPRCGLCWRYVSPNMWLDCCGHIVLKNFGLLSVDCVTCFTLAPLAFSHTLCAEVEVPFSSSMAFLLNKFCCVDDGSPCPPRVSTCKMVWPHWPLSSAHQKRKLKLLPTTPLLQLRRGRGTWNRTCGPAHMRDSVWPEKKEAQALRLRFPVHAFCTGRL